MSDLISRCELFNRLAPVQTLGDAYAVIQGMETEDAVSVVRCKNCLLHQGDPKFHELWCTKLKREVEENDFCSWGVEDD